ncbi:MAG: GNAT family N-acetyltransferase [Anaerolineae bacterium]|nr:GNAT family N-acetyltransferase [Anaerolineae bacterium]
MVKPEWVQQYETLTLQCWPALETEEYDGWILRSAQGHTGRANSVYPLAESSLVLADKLTFVESWYRQRGLPAIFKLTEASQPPELDSRLAERGYLRSIDTLLQAADLQPIVDFVPDESACLTTKQLPQWLRGYAALSGKSLEQLQGLHKILQNVHTPLCAFLLPGLSAGVAILSQDAIMLVHLIVAAEQRGKGHGRALTQNLLAWGMRQGAQRAFLQVTAENVVALQLYAGFGFTTQYRYWYRTASSPTN